MEEGEGAGRTVEDGGMIVAVPGTQSVSRKTLPATLGTGTGVAGQTSAVPSSGMAVASIVFGILAMLAITLFGPLAILFAVPAIVFGYLAQGRIGRSGGALSGASLAKAGMILGYVGMGLGMLMALFFVLVFAGMGVFMSSTRPGLPPAPPAVASPGTSPPPLVERILDPRRASINRARAEIQAMSLALERYRAEFGEYPSVAGGSTDPEEMAKCLYQALSGDGSDKIEGSAGGSRSTGEAGRATDGLVFLDTAIYDRDKVRRNNRGFVHADYYLQDPWGRPYRYQKAGDGVETQNPTYDLWSWGNDETGQKPESWITNWQ